MAPVVRDLLISSAELDVDKLDFTLDERWFTPLQQWLQVAGRGQETGYNSLLLGGIWGT